MNRKGQFTIPNLVGVAVLFFIFAVVGKAFLFDAVKRGAESALKLGGPGGIMTAATLYTLPAIILLAILIAPFALAQINFEERQREKRKKVGRR